MSILFGLGRPSGPSGDGSGYTKDMRFGSSRPVLANPEGVATAGLSTGTVVQVASIYETHTEVGMITTCTVPSRCANVAHNPAIGHR